MKWIYTKFYRAFFIIRVLAIVLPVVLFTSACKEVGSGDCQQPFTKTILPVKIQDGHDLYFNIDDFDFAADSSLVINDITFSGTVTEHKKGYENFSFSVNGIKASRRDGEKCAHVDRDHVKNHANFSIPVHKFYLNGGYAFADFMAKVKIQRGELRLQLHGEDDKLVSGQLLVTGTKYNQCQNPPPPPPAPAPVAPKTTIVSTNPATSPTASTTITVTFSADQTGVTFACKLDGGSATPCTSPISYSSLGNGGHTFTVSATNSAGLFDITPPSYSWTVDTVPPTVTINNLASLPAITNNTSITVLFSSTKAGTFSCALDGATAACTSPVSYSGIAEGPHTITISEVDTLGNTSTNPAIFQWSVDLTAPVTSIISATPSGQINNSSTMSFQFTANESATFACSVDSNAFQACTSPFSLAALTEGAHSIAIRATDVAGNLGLPVSYSWNTDYTAPVITLVNVIPAAQGETNARSISVSFTVSEIANIQCSFDNVVTSPCSSPFASAVTTQGLHTLVISATDLAGNIGVPQNLSWTMDFTLPTIAFGEILPSAAAYINVGNLSVQVIPSEPVNFVSSLNGVALGQNISPISLSSLAEGSYVLSVTGIDMAGNPSNTITHSFTVDMTAPTISVASAVAGLTNLDTNTLTFTASETVTYVCNIGGAGYASCATPLTLSGLADGVHTVLVQAFDLASNASAIVSTTWTVDTKAPTTTISGQTVNRNTVAFTFGSNEANSTFTCSVDGAAFQSCSTPMNYTFTDGAHTFVVKATDAAGNTDPIGALYNFTTRPAVTTTLVSKNPGASLTNINNISFTFSSNQADATFRCSLDGSAFVVCISPTSYSALADGSHTFKVQAVDIYGTVDATGGVTYTWTVDTTAPVVSNITTLASSSSVTISWTTNKVATSMLNWGLGSTTGNVVADDGVYATSHSVKVIGLNPNTTYTFIPGGHDLAGNNYSASPVIVRTGR